MTICRPQGPCLCEGLGTANSKHAPNGLKEELYPNIPGISGNSSEMLGFGLQVIRKVPAILLINNHVGQIKLLSEHLNRSLYLPVCMTLSPRLHRNHTDQGAYLGNTRLTSENQSAGGPSLDVSFSSIPCSSFAVQLSAWQRGGF